jgi:integrase
MCHICNAVRNAIHGKSQSIKPVPPIPTILSNEQEQALLAAIEKISNAVDLRDVVTLILGTGIRQGELRQLKWSEVDLKAGELNVAGRRVPLSSDLIASLTERATRVCAEHVMGRRPEIATMKAFRDLELAANSIGLPRLTLHDLRYTFAARCMASGMSALSLRRLCGWSTAVLRTIGQRIAKAAGPEIEDANDAMKDLKVTN